MEQCNGICGSAYRNAVNDARDGLLRDYLKKAKEAVHEMRDMAAQAGMSGRGHEFDDLFAQWSQENGGAGWQFGAD